MTDVASVETELERLRRERERLGAVNLRAEEELGEIETQHTTLTTERDDLVEAIARLRQGIVSLNKEARERLLSSFANVNTQFQRLFTELFAGGTVAFFSYRLARRYRASDASCSPTFVVSRDRTVTTSRAITTSHRAPRRADGAQRPPGH